MLHASKTWPLTKPNLQHLQRNGDQTDLQYQAARHCHHQIQWTIAGLALRIWISFWRREGSAGMDMWNAPMVQSRQPLTYRLMESVGLGGQRWQQSSWQRGIAKSGSSQISTLMIDILGDMVWDLPYVQQASYLKGGPTDVDVAPYLHVNKKSVDDDDDDELWLIFVSTKI